MKTLLPPRGVFVPTKILFDKSFTPTVRDTAAQLLALSWGSKETPPLSFEQLKEITGKSIPTLYGHLRLLRIRGALRWRTGGNSTFIFSLMLDSAPEETEAANSKNQEMPVNNPLNVNDSINVDNTSNSEFLENKNPLKTTTLVIKNKYCELLGYVPHNWAEGEGAAAKVIAEHFTVAEFESVYRHMKAQKFWQDKHLMLRQVKPQMQGVLAYLKNGGGKDAADNGADRPPTKAEQAIAISRQHDAERAAKLAAQAQPAAAQPAV